MNVAKVYSRALTGMMAEEVIAEVHVASGLPSFSIVGLADTEVKESRDRVRSAIQSSGYNFPARRITVNLAPADLPKDSSRYDLPIALGILVASGLIQLKLPLEHFEFSGELALDGTLRPIKGALALACGAATKLRQLVLPERSAEEAALFEQVEVLAAGSLQQVIEHLNGGCSLTAARAALTTADVADKAKLADMKQIKGQLAAKKALELAAAGRHSLLLVGNPGCGKSMLASRITSIMPLLTTDEAITSAALHSLSTQGFNPSQWRQIPFRNPHHSSSRAAIIGGGSDPLPGEISLAHHGVLFLDELAEFERRVLEALREPLENKKVQIARSRYKIEFAADFQLIAAMNPCPCGNFGHPYQNCSCSLDQIKRYRAKVSGAFLDRIDMLVELPILKTNELLQLAEGESSAVIRQRVISARQIQQKRQQKLNSALLNEESEKYCILDGPAKILLTQIINNQSLSARGYYRLLKLARTVADLAASEIISSAALALASQYKGAR